MGGPGKLTPASPLCTLLQKSVGDLSKADLEGKTVFVRADLNVPLDKDLNITDDTRIRAAVPTLKYLVENGAKVLLTSHLVRTACEQQIQAAVKLDPREDGEAGLGVDAAPQG